jgi:POT family proton-dependent oligopeptide transporter
LEYAYTQAPKSMKSTMNAIWLLTVTVGNLFDAFINSNIASGGFFSRFTGANYFWLFVGIISGFIVLYLFVSKSLPEKSYLIGDEVKGEAAIGSKEP